MPTTRSRTAGAAEAADVEEMEASVISGSSEVRVLQHQLAVVTDLVTQQVAAARQQMDAARQHEKRMKQLEDLLLQQTTYRGVPESIPTELERDTTARAQSLVLDTPPTTPRVEIR